MTTSVFDFKGYCHRCGCVAKSYTRSQFDDACICPECEKKEKAHPLYQKAAEAQLEHMRAFDPNFSGIGLPEDLKF